MLTLWVYSEVTQKDCQLDLHEHKTSPLWGISLIPWWVQPPHPQTVWTQLPFYNLIKYVFYNSPLLNSFMCWLKLAHIQDVTHCKTASVLMLEIKDALMFFEKEKRKKKETDITFPCFERVRWSEAKTMTPGHADATVRASASGVRRLGRMVVFVLMLEPLVSGIFQGTAGLIDVLVAIFKTRVI